jgi:predicted transcriptional regulator YheO
MNRVSLDAEREREKGRESEIDRKRELDSIQETLRFAQFRSSKKGRSIVKKIQAESIFHGKIATLQDQIQNSKQTVVKHILIARTLQHDLSQIKIIGDSKSQR